MAFSRKLLVGFGIVALSGVGAVGIRDFQKIVWPDKKESDGSLLLPNGYRISPAGRAIDLKGDLPLKMALADGGRKLLVLTGGYHDQGISVIDVSSEKVTEYKASPKATAGLALLEGGKDFVMSRADLGLATQGVATDGDKWDTVFPGIPKKQWFAGVVQVSRKYLVAADMDSDSVMKIDSTTQQAVLAAKVGYRPFAVAVAPDEKTVAVTNLGGGSVSLLDPVSMDVKQTITVGSHPNDALYASDGTLFVCNGGSNTVSVIQGGQVISTVFTSMKPTDPLGSTPDAMALFGDTLYVANADNNNVAVIDVSNRAAPVVKGFIPTGWYPSSLCVSADGKKLFIGIGKGNTFIPNGGAGEVNSKFEAGNARNTKYIGMCLSGAVNVVDIPNGAELRMYTAQAERNLRSEASELQRANEEAIVRDALHKIKHVVYVIRENRTYDQVFGDLKGTNAEQRLVMFGEKVTPNAHTLAKTFGAFDNFYCDGEVSQDGHQWCNSAYCTEFTEAAWVNSYSSRGQPDGDDRVSASPGGYLWDLCREHGKTYRSYGEFASFKSSPETQPIFTGNKGLEGHASVRWGKTGGRDYERISIFIDEMKEAEKKDDWPEFMVMSLGEDHTSGLRANAFTPSACVASNDLALGKMVEAISHSKFWKETAIFVTEDDAQNGPDHVDAHRTVGLVISPYAKRGIVDSTLYCTGSMLRTMELILHLPPMTQHDRHATPMTEAFTASPDFAPYVCRDAEVDLDAKNPAKGKLADLSAALDFSEYDKADPDKLNEILWAWSHASVPMPKAVHSATLMKGR